MTNPDVLILDEATEGLAPLIAREIWRICSLIKDSGISSVIVDKNWKHVTQITDRNVILVKGQVVFDGSSDALHAQPLLLEQLRQQFDQLPPLPVLTQAICALAAQIRQHGVFNFMLSNGDALFTHCSTHLHYLVRQAPFSTAHLIDNDVNIDFAEVTTPNDRVAVIATLPLTDNEAWTAHPKDTVLVFHEGAPLALPAAACQA